MRSAATLALTLVALVTVACHGMMPAGPGGKAAGARLSTILESGQLRVGTSGDLPPLNMRDSKGEIRGFEPDLIEALAGAMNLDIQYVVKPFPELLPALEKGEVDLVIAGMTITPSRNARVAFAGPYFISGTSMVARTGTLEEVRTADELDDPGRTFAALEGSTSARFVEDVLPRARRVTTNNYESAVAKLIAGEVDAVVADHLACKLAVWRNPTAGLSTLMTPFTTEPLGIALPADDPLLLNLVQNFLNTIRDTGELTLLKARWLADGDWLEELR